MGSVWNILRNTSGYYNADMDTVTGYDLQAFNEIKNYYNDITSNNLDLIKTLKEDVAEMKKKEALNEKLMYEISTENKRLSEPLNRALKVSILVTSESIFCTEYLAEILFHHYLLHECRRLKACVNS